MSSIGIVYIENDYDSLCGAMITYRYLQSQYPDIVPDLLKANTSIPVDVLSTYKKLYLMGYLYPPSVMSRLLHSTSVEIFWIDNDISRIESKALKLLIHIPGVRDTTSSISTIAWNTCYPDTPVPFPVYCIGEYSLGRIDTDIRILPFNRGLHAQIKYLTDLYIWEVYLDTTHPKHNTILTKTVELGAKLILHNSQIEPRAMRTLAHEVTFEGLKCIAVNRSHITMSSFQDIYNSNKYDVALAYSYTPGNKSWSVKLYTDKDIDFTKILIKYPGTTTKSACAISLNANQILELINS